MTKRTSESDHKASEPLPGQTIGPNSPADRSDNRARSPIREEKRPREDRQKLPVDGENAYGQESH